MIKDTLHYESELTVFEGEESCCDPSFTCMELNKHFSQCKPSLAPSASPTNEPTSKPTSKPTSEPTSEPTNKPTSEPTIAATTCDIRENDMPFHEVLYVQNIDTYTARKWNYVALQKAIKVSGSYPFIFGYGYTDQQSSLNEKRPMGATKSDPINDACLVHIGGSLNYCSQYGIIGNLWIRGHFVDATELEVIDPATTTSTSPPSSPPSAPVMRRRGGKKIVGAVDQKLSDYELASLYPIGGSAGSSYDFYHRLTTEKTASIDGMYLIGIDFIPSGAATGESYRVSVLDNQVCEVAEPTALGPY